jgi:hypothetical protein
VKELFAKVALRFCDLEERIGSSIGEPRLRQVSIVSRHHQFLDATDLRVDEAPELCRTVALRCRDAATGKQQNQSKGWHPAAVRGRTLFARHISASGVN